MLFLKYTRIIRPGLCSFCFIRLLQKREARAITSTKPSLRQSSLSFKNHLIKQIVLTYNPSEACPYTEMLFTFLWENLRLDS